MCVCILAIATVVQLGAVVDLARGAGGAKPPAGELTAQAVERSADPQAPPIRTKWTQPTNETFVEHDGPYWTIGRSMKIIRRHMLIAGADGPMFARFFPRDPDLPAGRTRIHVGAIPDRAVPVEPPLRIEARPAEFVAFTVISGSYRNTIKQHAALEAWAQKHGHISLGEITEVYYPIEPGEADGKPRTEIRLRLQPKTPPPVVAPANPEDTQRETLILPEPPVIAPALEPIAAPVEPAQTPLPIEQEPEPVRPISDASGSAEVVLTIGDLIEAKRFDDAARRVLRDNVRYDQATRLWVALLVGRVNGVVTAMEYSYPDELDDVEAVARALQARFREVSRDLETQRAGPRVQRMSRTKDGQAAAKRAILKDVDALVGQVMLKLSAPPKTITEIGAVLDRASVLLQPAGASEVQDSGESGR